MYLFTILLVLAESLEAAMSMLSCVIIDHSELESQHGDFPGSPVVKTRRYHCRGCGFDIPSQGMKTLHAVWYSQKKSQHWSQFRWRRHYWAECMMQNV